MNGVVTPGSLLLYEGAVLGWAVGSVAEVGRASLALVRVVRPKPDILVLGLGAGMPRGGVPAEARALAREEGVTLEALPTAAAISTYNILAGEDRRVLGAFLVQPNPAARGDG